MGKKKEQEQEKKTNWVFLLGALITALLTVAFAFLAGKSYEPGQDEAETDENKGDEKGTSE